MTNVGIQRIMTSAAMKIKIGLKKINYWKLKVSVSSTIKFKNAYNAAFPLFQKLPTCFKLEFDFYY